MIKITSVLNVSILVGLAFGCTACRRANDPVALPDFSAVYRADKELSVAYSMKPRLSNFESLFVRFKSEISILRDQVSADSRLAAVAPLVGKYERIARLYQLHEQIQITRGRDIDCVETYSNKLCEKQYRDEAQAVRQGITPGDIACDPVNDDSCNLRARISELETDATNAYMSLTHSQRR